MNVQLLPSPLLLTSTSSRDLTIAEAHSQISSFLNSYAPTLLGGGGHSINASLSRLVDGLRDELLEDATLDRSSSGKMHKKRRKNLDTTDGTGERVKRR